MSIKTGKEIRNWQDFQKLVAALCLKENNYTQEDIYNLTQEKLAGSNFVVQKKLRTLINQTLAFLVRYQLLDEVNGVYSHHVAKVVTSTML